MYKQVVTCAKKCISHISFFGDYTNNPVAVTTLQQHEMHSMRCAKKCFYDFGESNWGIPTPEICFLAWQLRRTIYPKERYGDSLSVGKSDTQPSN